MRRYIASRRINAMAAGSGADTTPTLLSGLEAYWKMDEGSGDRADSSGNGLTLTDGSPAATGFRTGKLGLGPDFVASESDYLYLQKITSSVAHMQSDTTFAAWIFPDSGAATGYPYGCYYTPGNNRGWLVRYNTGGSFELFLSSNGSSVANEVMATGIVNTWTHVVLVWDETGNLMDYWINGSNAGDLAPPGTGIYDGSSDLLFGNFGQAAAPAAGLYFDGCVDEVGVWSRQLTSTEIGDLYNGGTGLTYPFT